ncbi:conserved protein, unknown function [Hepatocystis sp. ex Piliocolobus tephrosceles]|nr:conserved protein, unknown function [Hepatocystis sp. ex Piliocolobus tephrosceles]
MKTNTCIFALILLIYAYLYLSYLLYKLLIRNKKFSNISSAYLTGEKTRSFLFTFLFFCNISRIISLTILTCLDIRSDSFDYNNLLLFPNFYLCFILLKIIPTYFFLSSFTIIILFWSQVYYASILVSFPYLQLFYILINILVYVLHIIVARLVYITQSAYYYVSYNYILEAVLNYVIAVLFLYYGIKIVGKLKDKSRGMVKKNSIINRILSLAIVMFVILFFKGLYTLWCFVQDLNFYDTYFDFATHDALVYFISECIPTFLIIYTFQRNKEKNNLSFRYTTPLCSDTYDPYNIKTKKKKTRKKKQENV